MPTPGRNDPCPCGSGKKYKRCCLDRDQAATRTTPAAKPTARAASAANRRARADEELRATLDEAMELDNASNAVVHLINAGRLDEAERAARELLVRYPEIHDGHDRLGMLYEARGMQRAAADSYRQVLDIMRAHPGDHDPEMEQYYLDLIAKLDPPTAN